MDNLPRDILAAIAMAAGSSKPALISKSFGAAVHGMAPSIACDTHGGRKALVKACDGGRLEDVKKVMAICKDAGRGNMKALTAASSLGIKDVVSLLLESGAARSSSSGLDPDPMMAGKLLFRLNDGKIVRISKIVISLSSHQRHLARRRPPAPRRKHPGTDQAHHRGDRL
jgi:hypothetical protein